MPCGVMTDGRLGMSARARRRGVTFLLGAASAAFGAAAAPAASATLDRAKLEANLVTVSTTVADSGDTSPAAARWARGDVGGVGRLLPSPRGPLNGCSSCCCCFLAPGPLARLSVGPCGTMTILPAAGPRRADGCFRNRCTFCMRSVNSRGTMRPCGRLPIGTRSPLTVLMGPIGRRGMLLLLLLLLLLL